MSSVIKQQTLKLRLSVYQQEQVFIASILRWFGPVQFNDSGTGKARFSSIYDNKIKIIPTIYAAASVNAALMESTQMWSMGKNKEDFKTSLGNRYTSFLLKNKIHE